MSSLLLDLRHAVGPLTAPTVAVFTLPLAVGATTAIFSVATAVCYVRTRIRRRAA